MALQSPWLLMVLSFSPSSFLGTWAEGARRGKTPLPGVLLIFAEPHAYVFGQWLLICSPGSGPPSPRTTGFAGALALSVSLPMLSRGGTITTTSLPPFQPCVSSLGIRPQSCFPRACIL